MARAASTSPHGDTHAALLVEQRVQLVRSNADWARRLRQAVAPNESILALVYQPNIYIEAGRLPMPGFADYFPWDADYAKHPWFGQGHDICIALRRTPPPVIFDNNWVVWNRYSPKSYMPCVGALLADAYSRQGTSDFYVRNDRVAAWRR